MSIRINVLLVGFGAVGGQAPKQKMTLEVDPSTTLDILVQMIEAEAGVPHTSMDVFFNNSNLIGFGNTLEFYGIQQDSRITIRKKQTVSTTSASSFTPAVDLQIQKKIEEEIRQRNVHESFERAMEYHPESFVPVEMLYVSCLLNKHPINAFIDTGAQKSVISPELAESCGLMGLLDRRFQGMAVGVGTSKIIGNLHYIPVQIGSQHLPCSISVVEGIGGSLFIFGLDMLKQHRIRIDLENNCLFIQNEKIPFVSSSALRSPDSFSAASTSSSFPESAIKTLVDLGLSRETAVNALEATGGDPNAAASLFLQEEEEK